MESQAVIDYILANPTSSLGHILREVRLNNIDIDPAIVIHYKRLCDIIFTQKEEIANLKSQNNLTHNSLVIHCSRNINYERLLTEANIPRSRYPVKLQKTLNANQPSYFFQKVIELFRN